MTLIRRTNPFGELVSLRQAMDRLFEDSYVRPSGGYDASDHSLALDIHATQDALVVEAALPGVKPEDVDVQVLGDTLTISGSTRAEEQRDDDGYSYREIRRGSFSRTVTLPGGLKTDAATASFENGLLRLHPQGGGGQATADPDQADDRTQQWQPAAAARAAELSE